MKLKEDLLERVRKGELIVDNDSDEVINMICTLKRSGGYYVFNNNKTHHFPFLDPKGVVYKPFIKASELIEKEDYTKPLEKGQLCVFFDDIGFIISFYKGHYENELFCQLDAQETIWKYAFPYEGQTQAEIQEKINNYLKDK